jgi:hypothetical protein
MPKESTIQHYSSSTTGNIPAAIDLATGELAINIADEKVFLKNLGGSVVSLSQTKDLSGTFAAKNQTVTSFNGSTGAVNFYPALATSSVTGVASFNTTDFTVTTGAVALKGVVTSLNGLTGARTLTGDGGALQGVAGTAITSRLATTSATGVASFNATRFSVVAGAVDLAAPYQITGDTVAAVGSASVTRSGNIATIDNRLATTSLTGVASFSSTNFDVASGAVSIKTGGVPNAALANSSFTLRDEVGGTDTISLGDTLTITGGRGVDFIRTTTDTYEVRGVTATSSVLGVASFNATRFSVVNGAVDLAAPYQITGDTVAAVGSASVTRSGNIATINNRLATTSLTGVASFSSTNFDVASGAVSIKNVVTTFNGASGAINYYPPMLHRHSRRYSHSRMDFLPKAQPLREW